MRANTCFEFSDASIELGLGIHRASIEVLYGFVPVPNSHRVISQNSLCTCAK